MALTTAIANTFFDSFAKLPRKEQQKVSTFLVKFQGDPDSPGIHLEKIHGADGTLRSARIDDEYRAIIARIDDANLVLWVDHHDEAYQWASRKKCQINPMTGALQIFETETPLAKQTPVVSPHAQSPVTPIFSAASDDELLEMGVPADLLEKVRSYSNVDEFEAAKVTMPSECYENLEWLANGFSKEDVLEMIREQREEEKQATGGGNPRTAAEALQTPESQESFVVVDGEDELYEILSAPLEKWRVFLHPSQRKLANRSFNGPARVLGLAGTGKTVVAMHRAKHLASTISDDKRILFTTFSSNLASDIQDNLKKICTTQELRRIDVINLDAWVSRFLASEGFEYDIEYNDDQLRDAWEEAIDRTGVDLGLEPSFYADEWAKVIIAQPTLTIQDYAHAKRTGRGTRLGRKERLQVWQVAEEYRRIMRERGIRDVDSAMYDATKILAQSTDKPRYEHVIVDEGQDFSPVAYRLIRALAGEEHPNDIFIVGDAHQRIYSRRAVLSRCGINVRGRSSILRINYRTTEEIHLKSLAVLEDLTFDDLDGGIADDDITQSLVHGANPEVHGFANSNKEIEFICNWLKRMLPAGTQSQDSLSGTCIVVRTKKLLDSYADVLREFGFDVVKLKSRKADDRSIPGVRIATMHRVKGLEFDHVIIASVQRGTVPPDYAQRRAQAEGNEDALLQEERSLLYVAMTRAKQDVLITYYGKPSEIIANLI